MDPGGGIIGTGIQRQRARIQRLEEEIELLRSHGISTGRLQRDLDAARRTYMALVNLAADAADHARKAGL